MRYFRLPSLLLLSVTLFLASCTEQFLENGEKLSLQNASIQLVEPSIVKNKVGIPDDSYIVVYKDSVTITELKKELS